MHHKGLALIALLALLVTIGFSSSLVSAGTSTAIAYGETRTDAGVSTRTFAPDSRVYISWGPVTPVDGTIDVAVYAPDDSTVAQWVNQPIEASGTSALSFIAAATGNYDIIYSGQGVSLNRTIFVHALSTAGTVTGLDSRTAPNGGGESLNTFNLGSTVYLSWGQTTPQTGTVDVTVIAPDGSIVSHWANQPHANSGTLSFIVDQEGYYDIEFGGQRSTVSLTIAGISIFVLPETELGALAAILTGVCAVGVFATAKKRGAKA